jgi:hypothetical protein
VRKLLRPNFAFFLTFHFSAIISRLSRPFAREIYFSHVFSANHNFQTFIDPTESVSLRPLKNLNPAMRKLSIPLLHRLAPSPALCRVLDSTLVKAADFYKRFRVATVKGVEADQFMQLQDRPSKDLTVLHGPFVGMKYPGTEAAGSAFIA